MDPSPGAPITTAEVKPLATAVEARTAPKFGGAPDTLNDGAGVQDGPPGCASDEDRGGRAVQVHWRTAPAPGSPARIRVPSLLMAVEFPRQMLELAVSTVAVDLVVS